MTHWRLQKEESTHMNQSCSSVRTKSSLWILLYCWAWTHIHNTQKAQALYRKTLNTFSIFKRKQPGGGCEPTRGRVALSREARVVRPPDTLDLLNNSPRAPLDTGEEHWDRANQILSESFFDSFSRPTIHSLPTGYSPGQTIMHRCSVLTFFVVVCEDKKWTVHLTCYSVTKWRFSCFDFSHLCLWTKTLSKFL